LLIITYSSQHSRTHSYIHSFPTRRSSDLFYVIQTIIYRNNNRNPFFKIHRWIYILFNIFQAIMKFSIIHLPNLLIFYQLNLLNRSEEHTSELQSRFDLVCRLLLEKKKKKQ